MVLCSSAIHVNMENTDREKVFSMRFYFNFLVEKLPLLSMNT